MSHRERLESFLMHSVADTTVETGVDLDPRILILYFVDQHIVSLAKWLNLSDSEIIISA